MERHGTFIHARVIRSGALLVRAPTQDAARAALTIRTIGGHPVKGVVADKLNSTLTSVRSTDLLGLSDEELLAELQSQGVVEVQRLRSRNPERPNPRIQLRFCGKVVPKVIRAGYLYIEVELWTQRPQRCANCDRFGHTDRDDRQCRAQARCGRCQGDHPAPLCPLQIVAWCRHCELLHEPDNSDACAEWPKQQALLKQRAAEGVSRLVRSQSGGGGTRVAGRPPAQPKAPVASTPAPRS